MSTEILSFFSALGYVTLVILYSLAATILLFMNIVLWKAKDKGDKWLNVVRFGLSRNKLTLSILSILSAVPLFLALILYPPNNWDSMTYHLSRVEHWIQSGNLGYYPTSIDRQLFSQPFPEYIVLHLRLLTNSDFLSALGQYVSLFGSAVLAFLIARLFTKSLFASMISAALVLFLPMGILQASSTQTDLIASFFLLSFIYFGLRFTESDTINHRSLVFCATSFGILALTKYSAVLFSTPFLIWFSVSLIRRRSLRSLSLSIGMVIISVIVLDAPFLYRNMMASGSILGPEDMSQLQKNEGSLIGAAYSNSIRNYAIQLSTSNDVLNTKIAHIAIRLIRRFGLDANDVRNTWERTSFDVPKNRRQEDISGDFLVYLILPFSLMSLIFSKRLPKTWPKVLVVCVVSAFVIFSAVLKWQPWGTHLMLPFSMLACIVIGISFSLLPKRVAVVATGMFVIAGLPFVFSNETRPLLSLHIDPTPPYHRYEKYFVNRNQLYRDFNDTLSRGYAALKPNAILLSTGEDSWEYPLWAWFRSHHYPIPKIYTSSDFADFTPKHLYKLEDEAPDWFVSIEGKLPGMGWNLFIETPSIKLFFRADTAHNKNVDSLDSLFN
jgi:hypothetical protein